MASSLLLSLPAELEARLEAKAQAYGEEAAKHAERLLGEALMAPSLEEVLAPFRRAVEASRMSDGELDDFYEELRDKVSCR